MKEKRRLKRRYIIAEAKIRSLKGSSWNDAMVVNINREGLALYSKKPVRPGEKVLIKITFLERKKLYTVEELSGTIRWAQLIGKNYAAGLKFDYKVNKKDLPILKRCLEYVMKSNK